MHETVGAKPKGVRGCEELARMDWLDLSRCCDTCHSVQGYAGGSLGPCCLTLPDGADVFVCCVGKRQLLEEARVEVADWRPPTPVWELEPETPG
jgi:hypothetical protein